MDVTNQTIVFKLDPLLFFFYSLPLSEKKQNKHFIGFIKTIYAFQLIPTEPQGKQDDNL